MKLLDLPNDQWANLRAADEVPERLRRVANKAAFALDRTRPPEVARMAQTAVEITRETEADPDARSVFGAPPVEALVEEAKAPKRDMVDFPLSDDELDAADVYVVTRILAFVESWSFGSEVTEQIATDLPGGAYDAISEAIDDNYGADKVVENEDELNPTKP